MKKFPDDALAVGVYGAGETESGEYLEPAGNGEKLHDRWETT